MIDPHEFFEANWPTFLIYDPETGELIHCRAEAMLTAYAEAAQKEVDDPCCRSPHCGGECTCPICAPDMWQEQAARLEGEIVAAEARVRELEVAKEQLRNYVNHKRDCLKVIKPCTALVARPRHGGLFQCGFGKGHTGSHGISSPGLEMPERPCTCGLDAVLGENKP